MYLIDPYFSFLANFLTMSMLPSSNVMKRTLKDLECMERRLNIVLEGCLSPEELEERKKNRFDIEKKKYVQRLTDIRNVFMFLLLQHYLINVH